MTREIQVGPRAGCSFETGIRIFAAMAFPGPLENGLRLDAETAWCAQCVQSKNWDDFTDKFTGEQFNRLIAIDPKWAQKALRTVMGRLRNRRDVAQVLRPWTREFKGREPHAPVNGIKKFTQRQISMWKSDFDEQKASRFQERTWRVSRPVMHLVVAMEWEAVERGLPDEVGLAFDDLDFYEAVVKRAQRLQIQMSEDGRFKIRPEEQFTFIWKN